MDICLPQETEVPRREVQAYGSGTVARKDLIQIARGYSQDATSLIPLLPTKEQNP